jgi:hypothetical protein
VAVEATGRPRKTGGARPPAVILVTVVPVIIAARLTGGSGVARTQAAR